MVWVFFTDSFSNNFYRFPVKSFGLVILSRLCK